MKPTMRVFVAIATLTFAASSIASVSTSDVVITQISQQANGSVVLLQTAPRHSISGLSCTSDYWLTLANSGIGDKVYDTMVSMLLAAQVSKQEVTVFAESDGGATHCKLDRLVLGD